MNDDSGEAPATVQKPETHPNTKACIGTSNEDISFHRHIKLSPPQDSPLPKIKWPKQEPHVLVEMKERQSVVISLHFTPAVIKKVSVSELRTWTFYGDSATLEDIQKDIRRGKT